MYQNIVSQNQLLNVYQKYNTSSNVPFRDNELINKNMHVMNNLNELIREHKNPGNKKQRPTHNREKSKNIIEDMLAPYVVARDNKDVELNYKHVETSRRENIKITNTPYKSIIKDRPINKQVNDVKPDDMIVHKAIKGIDDNRTIFEKELSNKKANFVKINDELEMEFHPNNYELHKKKFEYKETFIRNLGYEEKIFDDNKKDCIDFYNKKQREICQGQQLCDQILHSIVNDDIIDKSELPNCIESSPDKIDIAAEIKKVKFDD